MLDTTPGAKREMNTQQPSRPVITPAMREQAAKQPNTWLYVVDPIFTDPNAEVPPWGFIGGYRVDERGQLTEDFSPNPNYRPSPVALRLPAPANDLERALQLTTTGYAQGHVLLTALVEAELILFAQPQGSGLFTMEHESGRRQLQVFTSDSYLPSNWSTWQRITGRQLTSQPLTGIDLQINPTSPVKARIPGEELMKAAGAVQPKSPAPLPAPAAPPATNGAVRTGTPTPAAAPSTPPQESAQPAAPKKPAQETEAPPAPDPAASDFGQRFLGSLLASAIGDALGAAVEFYPVEQIRSRFGERGVTDYDRNAERPGEFTDDTQMTLFTLEGLIRGHIAIRKGITKTPLPAVQLAYQRWLHTQGYVWSRAAGPFAASHPEPDGWLIDQRELFAARSPSSSCISSLREFASGTAPGTFDKPINDSKGCGGVTRAAAVALWSDHAREVFELAAAIAALTDSSPDAYLPAGVQAVIVQQLLRGDSLTDALDRARSLLTGYAAHERTDAALQAAVDLAAKGKPTPAQIKDTLGGGWSGDEALAIGVCAALSTSSLADAVMMAINHSGNSDSTGAICGSIAGAIHRLDTLPGVWLRDLQQRATVESLGRDALVEFGPRPSDAPEWVKRYPADKDTSELVFTSELPQTEPKHKPQQTSEDTRADRILGCILGGAAGDALGYVIESDSLEAIRIKHGPPGLTGFGPADGVISDDTQMTLFTLDGLIRASIRRRQDGDADPATQVQYAYQRWLHTQGFDWKDAGGPIAGSPPDGWLIGTKELFARRGPGTTCVQALHGFASGKKPGSLTERLNDSKGCGGVMRAAPAALWSDDATEVFRMGAQTAALTHGHPSGYLPAGVLAVIVHQLVHDRSLPEAVERALTELSTWDGHEETVTALRRAIALATEGTPTAEQIQDTLGAGSVGEEAIAIAVCAALTHPHSFSDAVVLAANHSGDSDSTAAICGNIMGAARTVSAIPQQWRGKVELWDTIEQLAKDAVREFGPNPPEEAAWFERYPAPSEDPSQETAETPAESPVAEAEPEQPEESPEPAEEPSEEPAEEPVAEQESTVEAAEAGSGDLEDTLSDEELRLLTAWRKFRDGDEDSSADLSQGLHKLLAEAFGAQRAAQLMGEAAEQQPAEAELAVETPVQLSRDERLAGSVLGTAAGDALGAPWMFAGLEHIERDNPEGIRALGEIFGRRGAATAIGQQTAFVLDGLIRADIRSRQRGTSPGWAGWVQTSLRHWLSAQGAPVKCAVPPGALAASEALRAQRFPDEATVSALASQGTDDEVPTASKPPNAARAVAAAARSGAIGFRADTPAEAVSLGCEIAVLTHGHPDGYLPAGALAGMNCALVQGQTLAESVQTVLSELDALDGSEATTQALRGAVELAGQGQVSGKELGELGTGWDAAGALGIAVAAALAHPESFVDAVSLAATHSGNSAATAALCGSLMGAARGVGDIPGEWLEEMELREVLDELIADERRVGEEIRTDADVPGWARRYLA